MMGEGRDHAFGRADAHSVLAPMGVAGPPTDAESSR
jgi:hypothetical protein